MSVLEAGEYRLENVRQATLALLSDLSPGTPLRANYKQDDKSDIWNVKRLDSGNYTFQNSKHNMYAVAGRSAQEKDIVFCRPTPQEWLIVGGGETGQYTIQTTDTGFGWVLVDNDVETAIALADPRTGSRNLWKFTKITE